jgi:hypothetical protein
MIKDVVGRGIEEIWADIFGPLDTPIGVAGLK